MKHIKVTGLADIDKFLSKVEPKLAKKVLKQSMRASLKETVIPAIKANAPVDTGFLQKQVKLRAGKAKRGVTKLNAQIGDSKFDNFYPKFVEYGTVKMQPQPFMRPAYDEQKDNAKDKTIDEIRKRFDGGVK